ncbi:hypothetical protein LZ32DRAFT_608268, partial [Colletotrichum eremochloae]
MFLFFRVQYFAPFPSVAASRVACQPLGLSALVSTYPYGAKSPSATLLQHFPFSKQGCTHQQPTGKM